MNYQDIFERHEKKYLLTEGTYRQLRRELDRFMAVDQYGETTILSLYYDTPTSRLIRRSIEKPVYKEKLRLRCYGVPETDSPAFLEIKKKYKGIVYKRRIAMPYAEAVGYMAGGNEAPPPTQIAREIDYVRRFYAELEPKMLIACERTAMAGIEDPELRITFDRNIRWRNTDLDLRHGADGRAILGDGRILMEVKIRQALSWEMAKLFSDLKIYSCSFSKYGEAYRQWLLEGREKSKQEESRRQFRMLMKNEETFTGVHHRLVSA